MHNVCYRAFLIKIKMEIILLQAFMTLLNIICALWMYDRENYKTAIFHGFAAGVCFMVFLNAI